MLEKDFKAVTKVQYVDLEAKLDTAISTVLEALSKLDQKGLFQKAVDMLDLENILERKINQLSGGELQRFIIAKICIQQADIYMFDEPSSYLDIKQRLSAAKMIRSVLQSDNYVVCVEHDLSILDYLSDFICCLYGNQGAYGVVTMPFSVREGINVFLSGFVHTENMRFRDEELTFKVVETEEEKTEIGSIYSKTQFTYP